MKTNPNASANVVDGMYAADAMRNDYTGLTKREYFAALAMQGWLSGYPNYEPDPKYAAERAVAHADALIAALNKEAQP